MLIDLRLAQIRYQLTANPDQLMERVKGLPDGKTIIIDEIQKVPELLPVVHMLIEQKRGSARH